MPTDLKATRETLLEAGGRIDHIEQTMLEIEKKTARRVIVFRSIAALFAVLIAIGIFEIHDSKKETARNAAAIERSNEIRETEARDTCDRGNKSIEVDRFLIEEKFNDYNLVANNQTPERQQFLANRRAQQLRRLEELRPIRDCDQAAAEATAPED